jgi:hypothetical protein
MATENPTNEGRAMKGRMALMGAGYDTYPDELDASIVDLVADLLHLARENDIEPDYIIHMANTHYQAELEEEAAAAKDETEKGDL